MHEINECVKKDIIITLCFIFRMKILVIGWGIYIRIKRFTIDFTGTPTIEKIGPLIRRELRSKMSSEVFEYIYERIRIFKNSGELSDGVTEVTCNEELKGAEDLMIMPGPYSYESFLNHDIEEKSKFTFQDSRKRFFSLAGIFGIKKEFSKDQEKLVKTMYELGNLGFFGIYQDTSEPVTNDEITIQCGHCHKKTKILKTLSAEQVQTIHTAESPACIMTDSDRARKICDEKEKIENYYTSQLAFATRMMLQQSNKAEFYAKKRYQERQLLFQNARHPVGAEKNDDHGFNCVICASRPSTILAVPCYHLSTCNSCFIQMKDMNDRENAARAESEPEIKLRCPMCNLEPMLFTKVYGDTVPECS